MAALSHLSYGQFKLIIDLHKFWSKTFRNLLLYLIFFPIGKEIGLEITHCCMYWGSKLIVGYIFSIEAHVIYTVVATKTQ